MKKYLLALALAALLIFSSGCNDDLTEKDLQKIPEAKAFLEKYPDAIVKISYFSIDKFKTMKAYAPSSCKSIPEDSYYKLMLVSNSATLYIYAVKETLSVACAHWEGSDECLSSEGCDDKDPTTKNVCSGTPKKCSFELKTCKEQKGDVCTSTENCAEQFIKAADSELCCPEKCAGGEETSPCANVSCNENEKCDNGECRLKTCGELSGVNCSDEEFCQQAFHSTPDSNRCCPVACSDVDPCAGTECAPHLKCVGGKCELKNCDERGGYACGSGEVCIEGFISSANSAKCCPSACKTACGSSFCLSNQKCINGTCRIFTCGEMGGLVCPGTTKCNEPVNDSFDKNNCCVGTCVQLEVPTPTPTAAPTPSPTPSLTPTPSPTPSPTSSPTPIPTPILCGTDFDCFIEAVENGNSAETLYVSTIDIIGIIQTTATRMENRELGVSGNYEYYQKTESAIVEYSEELKQQLLDSGLTQEEINQQEQQTNEQVQVIVGIEATCKYNNPFDLVVVLNDWAQGNYSTNDFDFCAEFTTTGPG